MMGSTKSVFSSVRVHKKPSVKNESPLDVESVCDTVITTSRQWGRRPVEYVPNCPEKLRGISSKVVSLASLMPKFSDLNGTTCYESIIPALCHVQFEKASPGCQDTAQLFFDIISTCVATQNTLAAYCPSFDPLETQQVDDPRLFCSKATLGEYGPEDKRTGVAESLRLKSFQATEQRDCETLVMLYNSCVQFGIQTLGYPYKFCVTPSFSAYCHYLPQATTQESQFRTICENIVVPTLMEYYVQHHRHPYKDFCTSIYQRSLTYLASKKGAAYKNVQMVSHNLQLSAKPLIIMNRLKGPLILSKTLDASYSDLWKVPLAYLSQINNPTIQSVPSFLCREFYSLERAANEILSFCYSIKLPDKSSFESIIYGAKSTNSQLEKLTALQKKLVLSSKDFTTMITQYLNNSLPPESYATMGYEGLDNHRLENFKQCILTTVSYLDNFRKQYNDILNIWPIRAMANDQNYVYAGIRSLRNLELIDSQTKLLISFHFKTNAELFLKKLMEKP